MQELISDFCNWCNEYVRRKNVKCKECESCLKCQYFEPGCCKNEIVVAEYREEWERHDIVIGIGPPLCRKNCPHLSPIEKQKAFSRHAHTSR